MNSHQHSKFYSWANQKVGFIQEKISMVKYFISLNKINESLIESNEKLLASKDMALYKNFIEEKAVADSLYQQQYKFTSAKVVNNSFINSNNYITINKGKTHGIKVGMGIFADQGIVGIIKSTSDRYAVALSILHSKVEISAKLLNKNNLGTLKWDGDSPFKCKLSYIPIYVKIIKGDSVVTSGFQAVFPEGLLIGTVAEINTNKENSYYDLKIKLSQDLTNLSYVYVVENLFKDEQLDLEVNEE